MHLLTELLLSTEMTVVIYIEKETRCQDPSGSDGSNWPSMGQDGRMKSRKAILLGFTTISITMPEQRLEYLEPSLHASGSMPSVTKASGALSNSLHVGCAGRWGFYGSEIEAEVEVMGS